MGSQWAIIPGERGFDEVRVPPCRRHRAKGFRHCSEITRWTVVGWRESGERKKNGEYDNRNKKGRVDSKSIPKAQKRRIEKKKNNNLFFFSIYIFDIVFEFPSIWRDDWTVTCAQPFFFSTSPWIILLLLLIRHTRKNIKFCIDFAIPSQPVANNNQTVSPVATFIIFLPPLSAALVFVDLYEFAL